MIDGSLETLENQPAVRFERSLPHSVERVWRAVTEPAELERWFVVTVPWTPALGETFEAMGQSGEITELVPRESIAWTFAGDTYRFELRPEGEGCVLVFFHAFGDRTFGADFASGWHVHLDRLEVHLAGGHRSSEEAAGPAGELHERYAAHFGLDPEVGRATLARHMPLPISLEDGPMLRLERRYGHPVEHVWRAITDPDELAKWFPPGEELMVTESEPPHLLAGTWYGDLLRFELRPDGEGCVLVFTHAFDDGAKAARDGAGWDRCFLRLDGLLAGSPIDEDTSLNLWLELHERYAEHFGVDPELGREAFAQHPSQQ